MKTTILTSLAVVAGLSFAVAEDKTFTEKTTDVLNNAAEKTVEAGRAVADKTREMAKAAKDAIAPDQDARRIDVKLSEHKIDMPQSLEPGKTAFVVHNAGGANHNFEIEGAGVDEKFILNLNPNETKVLHVDLKSGQYKIYCPVEDHEEHGMKMNLTVK